MNTPYGKGTALITGGCSGIGAIYADRLAKAGFDLILVGRNEEHLRAKATKLTNDTKRSIEFVSADLTKPHDLARVEAVLKNDASITMLVNNVSMGATTPLLASDINKMEKMIALNVNVPTRLAYAVVPNFVARGTGTIINISSCVAIMPEKLNGVYGGTKAYVLALSHSLHHELAGQGIHVQAVLPGVTATQFYDTTGTPVKSLPEDIVMSAEEMVDAALAGLAQGELVTIPSLPDKADWDAFENARKQLAPNLSHSHPAARYGVGKAA